MVDKLLIIDFDSLFDVPVTKGADFPVVSPTDLWCAVPFALEKICRNHWDISLWSSRPRTYLYKALKTLLKTEIYYSILKHSWDESLIRFQDTRKHAKNSGSKIDLFNHLYGKIFDSATRVSVIESNKDDVEILQGYFKSRISVKWSPRIWLEILTIDDCQLDYLLMTHFVEGKFFHQVG